MSGTWQTLQRLTEASEKDALLNYILRSYGEHHHDEIKPEIDKRWNPEGLPELTKVLTSHYADPQMDAILKRAADKMGVKSASAKAPSVMKRRGAGDDPKSAIGGPSRRDMIAGLSSGDFMSPAEIEKQRQATASTAAMRPDRAGTQANVPPPKGAILKPGERPTHDIGLTPSQAPGSAPGHTRPVQKQVSQTGGEQRTVGQQLDHLQGLLDKDPDHPQKDKIQKAIEKLVQRDPDELLAGPSPVPTRAGSDLERLRANIEKAKKRQVMLIGINGKPGVIQQMAKRAVGLKQSDPAKSQELARKVNQMRAELAELPKKIRDMESQISRISKVGKSGVSDAQRKVDDMTDQYGKEQGERLAKKLGVPPTSARRKEVVDPDTGKKKIVTAIWSAEKIKRWMDSGPELNPGVYDLPGKPSLPGPEDRGGKEPTVLHKPMMKAPKGLSKDELQKLADLRRNYSSLKRAGASEEELQLAKQDINAIMARGDEIVDVVIPGSYPGMRWKPSGVSRTVRTMRPDKATGKMVYGKRETDPSQEGQELVWDGSDWILPSQWVSKRGERNAAELDKRDRPWASSSGDDVSGTPIPKDANTQRAQAMAAEPEKDDRALFRKHRGNKDAVQQAFFGKKGDEPSAAEGIEEASPNRSVTNMAQNIKFLGGASQADSYFKGVRIETDDGIQGKLERVYPDGSCLVRHPNGSTGRYPAEDVFPLAG